MGKWEPQYQLVSVMYQTQTFLFVARALVAFCFLPPGQL